MAVGSMARPVCHKRGERRRNGVVRGRHALVKAPTWFARTGKRLSDGSDGPTPSEGIPRLQMWEDVNYAPVRRDGEGPVRSTIRDTGFESPSPPIANEFPDAGGA